MCSINAQTTATVAASSSVDPVLRTSALLLGDGMREIFAEREACREAGLYYGVVTVGTYAAERIACLGGMAGEW